VTAVENTHYQFHSGTNVGKHKSYAYRFEAPDRVIVFTGDTGPSDAITELAEGADLLVTPTSSFKERMQLMIETGRWQAMTPAQQERVLAQAKRNITLEDIGKMAARANVKTVVLSHSNVRADSGEQWIAEVKQHFSGQVLVANDLSDGILKSRLTTVISSGFQSLHRQRARFGWLSSGRGCFQAYVNGALGWRSSA
jgi:ribonuclease BN (tRNA processing enzyme)